MSQTLQSAGTTERSATGKAVRRLAPCFHEDYLIAQDGLDMRRALRTVLYDPETAAALAELAGTPSWRATPVPIAWTNCWSTKPRWLPERQSPIPGR